MNKKKVIAAAESKSAAKKETVAAYTYQQLVDGHKVFGTSRELVSMALRGKETELFTQTKAKALIDTFKNIKR